MDNLISNSSTSKMHILSEWCERKGLFLFALWLVLTIAAPHQDNYKHFYHLVIFPVIFVLIFTGASRIDWRNPLLILALSYFTYAGLASIIFGKGPVEDHFRALRWSLEVTTACLAFSIWLPKIIDNKDWWGRFFLIIALSGSVLGLIKYSYSFQYDGRLNGYGALHNPIQAGSVLLVYFALGHFMLFRLQSHAKRMDKALIFMAFWCVGAVVVLSGSRAPLAALLAYSFYLASLSLYHKTSRTYEIALTLLALLLSFFVIVYWYGVEAFYQNLMDRGLSFRLEIWKGYVIAFKESIWLGVGLGTQPEYLVSAVEYWKSQGLDIWHHPHSVYVGIIVKTGLIGALFFAMISGVIFLKILKSSISADEKIRLAGILVLVFLLTLTASQGLISSIKAIWLYLWLPVYFVWFWCERKT